MSNIRNKSTLTSYPHFEETVSALYLGVVVQKIPPTTNAIVNKLHNNIITVPAAGCFFLVLVTIFQIRYLCIWKENFQFINLSNYLFGRFIYTKVREL